jgi:hypothetical protein
VGSSKGCIRRHRFTNGSSRVSSGISGSNWKEEEEWWSQQDQ